MKTHQNSRTTLRPVAGDKQPYPGASEGVWKDWRQANDMQRSQARHISKSSATMGAMLLVEQQSGRVLRVLGPAADQA